MFGQGLLPSLLATAVLMETDAFTAADKPKSMALLCSQKSLITGAMCNHCLMAWRWLIRCTHDNCTSMTGCTQALHEIDFL